MSRITIPSNVPASSRQQIEVSPAQLRVLEFISSLVPEDLYQVTNAALFTLADSELVEGKRWILVRLTEGFHQLSLENNRQ